MLLIIFLGLLVYSNTFDAPFQFDDYIFVEYRGVESMLAPATEDVASVFETARGPWASRPLLYATFMLNHNLDGFHTWGYHAVNIALHLLNALLLYVLVAMTGRHLGNEENETLPVALLSSALFVLHPIQTETVTMVVNRSMLMATTAYFSGLIFFFKAITTDGKEKNLHLVSLFLAALFGAASRENFATFPLMLFVYDVFFISRFRLRTVVGHYKAYIAALLGTAFLGYLVFTNTYSKYKDFTEFATPPFQYALTQFKIHWAYIRLMLFPINQNLFHDYAISKSLLEFSTFLCFIGYVGLWLVGLLFARRKPATSFGLLWFLVTLSPISFGVAFLNLRLGDLIFEHRLYLPSAGFIVLASLPLVHLARRRRALVPVIVTICILMGGAAYSRNYVWKDIGTFWADVVRKSPNEARGHNNYALFLIDSGHQDLAIGHLNIALNLWPENGGPFHTNLGTAYFKNGELNKAIEHFEIALKFDPDLHLAQGNLGIVYSAKGQPEKALEHYLAASRLEPWNVSLKNKVAQTYYELGQKEEAIKQYSSSLWLDKKQTMVLHNLSILFIETGQKKRAMKHLEALLAFNPGHLPARVTLAKLYTEEDLPFRAIATLEEAVKLRPDVPVIHRALAAAYEKVGNMQSADEHLKKAETLEKSLASKAP